MQVNVFVFQRSRFKDPNLIKRKRPVENTEQEIKTEEHLFKSKPPKSLGHVVRPSTACLHSFVQSE